MAELLLFGESFPLVLHFDCLVAPLLADNLGDFRIGKAWVLGNDFALMMLAIKDECYDMSVKIINQMGTIKS